MKNKTLIESENHLHDMLDTMAFSSFFFDPDGNVVDCNQQAVEMFGCTDKQEFLEKFFNLSPHFQTDSSQSTDKAREFIMKTFKTGITNVFYWDHLKTDGSRLPVEVTLIRIKWKDSYRVIAYIKDMSDLVETDNNFRRILATAESSPNFTIFLGPGGNIEYMNPVVFSSSGFSQEELHSKGLGLIFSPADYERLNREYVAVALDKGTVDVEMKLVTKSGEERDFFFSIFTAQMDAWNTGIGLIGKDITEQKLIQRDLAIAKEHAERALAAEHHYNQAKSDFLSRVSHELRTPLNAIIGIMSIVERNSDKKRRKMDHHITKISEATENLLTLINDILDMTGFDTGKFDFNPQPFSFSMAMYSVIDKIKEIAQNKNQEFIVDIDGRIHDFLIGDDRRLKQVLLNLLSNAIKFTPENGKIQLIARELSADGNECTIRFEVIDNGIGMTPAILQRLWDVLEQMDNSITREYGGLGLSLPLTKRIVELMNGILSVESEVGKGSRFICEVRLSIAQANDQVNDGIRKANVLIGGSSVAVSLSGKRILVVDDIELNREILYTMLEDAGAVFDGAVDGEEAIKMFSQNKYDLVLMDLHMPVLDGFTATKNIRATSQPWAKTVPIILVSAECSVELYGKCIEAGINEYLAKPVVIENLLGIISKLMPDTVVAKTTA
ncbi:MAG: response regulator [Treponema sp.]|nr:response regulator [Treponema sp.]